VELFGLLGHLELNVSDWPVRLPLSHSSIAGRTADANLHLASAFHQRADATADVGQAMALRKKSASFYVRACRVLDAIAEALLEPRQEPPPPPPPLQLPLSAARAAAHSGLAVVRQQLGELNEALEEYLLALEIFTSYIDVHVTQRLQQPSTQAAAAAAADPSSPSPSLPLSAAAAAAAAATAVSETPAVTVMSSDGSRNLSSVITVAETHLEIARIYIALGSEQVEQLGPHSVAERKLLRGAVQHYRLAVGVFEAEHGLQHGVNPEHARPRPPSGLPLFTLASYFAHQSTKLASYVVRRVCLPSCRDHSKRAV
jgi:tetratricopeptide (TPR) repeat protein